MVTFTSTLPEDLFSKLNEKSGLLSVPKNKLIENALRLYLEHIEKAEYIQSYKGAVDDKDILSIAEEGLKDYLRQIEE